MKTIEERLKEKRITPLTKNHSYTYLYKSIIEIMQEYEREIIALETIEHSSDPSY